MALIKGELSRHWGLKRFQRLVAGFRRCGAGERERSSEDPGVPPRCDDFVILWVGSRNFIIRSRAELRRRRHNARQTLAEMA